MVERRGYTYKIMDLEYPAVSVMNPFVALGAKISARSTFKFGKSVTVGIENLVTYKNSVQRSCPNTRWILAGYSQGAIVVTEAAKTFKPSEIVYIGLTGDPELYLPEGRGIRPDACRGKNLSPYRVAVPNCHTDNGSIGERKPFEYPGFEGKYGLWCYNDDFICGSSKNLLRNDGHVVYSAKGAYTQMLAIVDKKLNTNYVTTRRSVGGDIFAYATQTEYELAPGEEATFDLSPSISTNRNITSYLWSFDDGATWMSGEATITRSFETGEYKILAKVSDGFATSESLEISVKVGDFAEILPLSAPENLRAELVDDEIKLSCHSAPPEAKYLYIKLNSLPMGYVEMAQGYAIFNELEFDQLKDIELAWVDVDFNVGEFANLDVSRIRDFSIVEIGDWAIETPKNEENVATETPVVDTGVDLECIIWLFVIVAVVVAGLAIYFKI